MGELSGVMNLGKVTEGRLNEVGIDTYEELKRLGAKQAWLKIQEIDQTACIHLLYALEGAVCGVKKSALSDEQKSDLKAFFNRHKISEDCTGR